MALLPPGVHEDFPETRDELTPLFKQYCKIKRDYPEAVLFYRLGDFYEMFGPDAVKAAGILGLTLTARACFKGYKVAMCGIPHHASVKYIKQLVDAGEAIAICDQTEDAALAKGLVTRGVTRVITAGTLIEDEYLSGDSGNFMAVAAIRGQRLGGALLESSGGRVELFEVPVGDQQRLIEALAKRCPAEILLPRDSNLPEALADAGHQPGNSALHFFDKLPPDADVTYFLQRYFKASSLGAFGLENAPAAQAALFALIRYLKDTFKVNEIALYPSLTPLEGVMRLDGQTVMHLELLEGLTPGGKGISLYSVVNRCKTAGGRRTLKDWIAQPLADSGQIIQRQDAVGELVGDRGMREKLAGLLDQIQDIERIVHRVGLRRSHPKEVMALAESLTPLSGLVDTLSQGDPALLHTLADRVGNFGSLIFSLTERLAEEVPVKLSEGNVIKPGFDAQIDEYRELLGGGRKWEKAYEQQQRQRTGIRTLKVKQTEAFGFFIEVSKANQALVPEDYTRRQTLVNSERYTTPELSEHETKVRQAESRLGARERELFEEVCLLIDANQSQLANAARAASQVDCLLSLATVAVGDGWVKPVLDNGEQPVMSIEGGRHPLVEQAVGKRYYIKNDCYLSCTKQQVLVLTGPNMGGKSTYLRMAAVLAVLSQIGGFVPADSARLPVFQQIHTRIGAQDYLSLGQSTFMVEMVETAGILNTCGPRSLVLLDEVGRGTSTYDGISIAKAVVEHLHEHADRPLVLFATHFFELTDLELMLPRVKNFQVEVAKDKGRFVFLYRVAPGAASDSFGIEVAQMAGLPASIVLRSREILAELEVVKQEARKRARKIVQANLFQASGEDKS